MEPISTTVLAGAAIKVGGLAVEHLADLIEGKVFDSTIGKVVQACSKKRSLMFVEGFCKNAQNLWQNGEREKLIKDLDKIVEDELMSEILFTSYRQSVFAKSKKIGPRIIGFITAEAIHSNRRLSDIEETILDICEMLSDEEIEAFSDFYREWNGKINDGSEKRSRNTGTHLEICWDHESNEISRFEASVAPLNLSLAVGKWAARLESTGIISSEVREKSYQVKEDSERYIDYDMDCKEISWWIILDLNCTRLFELANSLKSNEVVK